jgi:hypothetical protein
VAPVLRYYSPAHIDAFKIEFETKWRQILPIRSEEELLEQNIKKYAKEINDLLGY